MPKGTKPAKAARTGKSADPAAHAVDITLELAAERGWRRVSLGDIAAAAKLSLAELYELYPSKAAILGAFIRRIDAAVLADGPAEGETRRDRLFDILMRRFEALRPYKAGVEAILREPRADPLGALCGAVRLERSLAWMLEAAGIDSGGLGGRARLHGLGLIYLATMRVWLSDDSPDMSRTMAALDKRLRRAETLVEFLIPRSRHRPRESSAEAA